MIKRILAAAGLVLVAAAALSCCAMFNAPKESVKAHLNAWAEKDYEEAFSYLASALQETKPFDEFKNDVDRVPIKSFNLTSISISGEDASAVVKGTITLIDDTKVGCRYELIQRGDEWLIWGYDISPDLLFEEDED